MDGLNEYRQARVAEILAVADFTTLQYYIAAAPADPPNQEDYYTEGWRALRQCALDGQHILNTGADTHVPVTKGGHEEQSKAELQQVHLDAMARRHQGQKIYLRQAAAQQWVERRDAILQGQRPGAEHQEQLKACDQQLWLELAQITDELVYARLLASDQQQGRWTGEDPSLRAIQRWMRSRR
ncbi:hypothetical protein SPI_03277 [Niveomyces insectorum RCEF 264]|uniref:Uncharacterized protein n=1 Tax=Niveomyces insectorum RCEF 264 TaxID=1081102 RepID=A0A162MNR8_9HYPO|nr:hypothetical protein SPI_03277 [Niveomyces insectorum RCEF 264]